ncbi:MAG: peptidylprolyl isomerase [Promicromonosporaceae bacterium]|nr:peptidylprolyl isomerase [Promicromonosporaceae bacterium]
MAQTQRQREAARRAQERRAQAEAIARNRRQHMYVMLAGAAALLVVAAVVLVAIFGSRTPETTYTELEGVPSPALAESRTWTGAIATNSGSIGIELYGQVAPQAVASFVTLADEGFFNGTQCHRLTTAGIYVLQCGDPTATGMGGPGYNFGPIENAPADNWYPAGTIAMARRGGDGFSMGSQFFLVYEDSFIPADQAGGYTVFGRITSGLDIVQAIADIGVLGGGFDGPPADDVIIEGVTVQ